MLYFHPKCDNVVDDICISVSMISSFMKWLVALQPIFLKVLLVITIYFDTIKSGTAVPIIGVHIHEHSK